MEMELVSLFIFLYLCTYKIDRPKYNISLLSCQGH